MTEIELKKWIKENLILSVEQANSSGSDNSIYVSLAFRDEIDPFYTVFIFIPEDK